MRTIFVMIKAELGRAYQVADLIVDTGQVSEVHSISGQYDLLVKVYLDEGDDIGHFVTEVIQPIEGIRDTFTLIGFRAFT